MSTNRLQLKKIHRNDDLNATEEDDADDEEKRPLTIHSAFYVDKNRQVETN